MENALHIIFKEIPRIRNQARHESLDWDPTGRRATNLFYNAPAGALSDNLKQIIPHAGHSSRMKQATGSGGSILTTTLHIPTFLLGIIVLLYIASFVIFAIIRIVTGVSIQRLGYLSLKRINYEPKDGIRIEVRKLGLLFHRPTYAQPSWVSLVIGDSHIIIDVRKKSEKSGDGDLSKRKGTAVGSKARNQTEEDNTKTRAEAKKPSFWEDTEKIKKTMQKLRRLLRYMKMLDIVFTNATLSVVDVGSVQISSTTISVDTRREAADRSRLFDHCKALKPQQKPIELIFTMRSVLLTPHEKEAKEILDHCIVNAYGVLEEGVDVILDSAMAVKFGRINVQFDEMLDCMKKLRDFKGPKGHRPKKSKLESLGILMEEMAMAGSRTERMAEAVMEWRVLLRTLLEGVKEVQFAIGHLVISKEVRSVQPAGKPLVMVAVMKELGMEVHRLDQKSPAHQMYDKNPQTMVVVLLIHSQVFFTPRRCTSGTSGSNLHLY